MPKIMDSDAEQRVVLRQHLGLDSSLSDLSKTEQISLNPSCYFYSRQKQASKSTLISSPWCPSSGISFFIERTPPTSKPERCFLKTCSRPFQSGRYRVAITPAMSGFATQNADLFHISCLEKIADLSDPAYYSYIQPFTRLTGGKQADGHYLCAGAVERLVLEWKARQARRFKTDSNDLNKNFDVLDDNYDKSHKENEEDEANQDVEEEEEDADDDESDYDDSSIDDSDDDNEDVNENDDYDSQDEGYTDDTNNDVHDLNEVLRKRKSLNPTPLPNNQNLISPLFYDLWYNAGSSRFNSCGPIPGMFQHEYFNLLTLLAPWESDDRNDNEEWNIFDVFLGKQDDKEKIDGATNIYNLSEILSKWERWVELVLTPESSLSPQQVYEKISIGNKGCRAIRRLAVIPMPQDMWQF